MTKDTWRHEHTPQSPTLPALLPPAWSTVDSLGESVQTFQTCPATRPTHKTKRRMKRTNFIGLSVAECDTDIHRPTSCRHVLFLDLIGSRGDTCQMRRPPWKRTECVPRHPASLQLHSPLRCFPPTALSSASYVGVVSIRRLCNYRCPFARLRACSFHSQSHQRAASHGPVGLITACNFRHCPRRLTRRIPTQLSHLRCPVSAISTSALLKNSVDMSLSSSIRDRVVSPRGDIKVCAFAAFSDSSSATSLRKISWKDRRKSCIDAH